MQQFPVDVSVDGTKWGMTRTKSFKEENLRRQEPLGKAYLQFSKNLGFDPFVIGGIGR